MDYDEIEDNIKNGVEGPANLKYCPCLFVTFPFAVVLLFHYKFFGDAAPMWDLLSDVFLRELFFFFFMRLKIGIVIDQIARRNPSWICFWAHPDLSALGHTLSRRGGYTLLRVLIATSML